MIVPKDMRKVYEVGDSVVSADEIASIWDALDKLKCYPTTKSAIKIATRTGAMLDEIRHTEASDIDVDTKLSTILKEKLRIRSSCRLL
ncbi:MAG: hypothetical protein ACI9VO_002339 [Colwellia sp.]|jgi:hypothetical protein